MDDVATEANSRPGSPVSPLPERPTTRPPVYRFNWDPSLRRAGPPSVSEATDNRTEQYGSPNTDFPLRNVSSLGLTLPHDWSSSKHGFNGTWTTASYRAAGHLMIISQPFLPSLTILINAQLLPRCTPVSQLFRLPSYLG